MAKRFDSLRDIRDETEDTSAATDVNGHSHRRVMLVITVVVIALAFGVWLFLRQRGIESDVDAPLESGDVVSDVSDDKYSHQSLGGNIMAQEGSVDTMTSTELPERSYDVHEVNEYVGIDSSPFSFDRIGASPTLSDDGTYAITVFGNVRNSLDSESSLTEIPSIAINGVTGTSISDTSVRPGGVAGFSMSFESVKIDDSVDVTIFGNVSSSKVSAIMDDTEDLFSSFECTNGNAAKTCGDIIATIVNSIRSDDSSRYNLVDTLSTSAVNDGQPTSLQLDLQATPAVGYENVALDKSDGRVCVTGHVVNSQSHETPSNVTVYVTFFDKDHTSVGDPVLVMDRKMTASEDYAFTAMPTTDVSLDASIVTFGVSELYYTNTLADFADVYGIEYTY